MFEVTSSISIKIISEKLKKNILLVPPQITAFDFGEEAINAEEYTLITCSVFKGDLPIEITWKHNSRTIDPLDGVTIARTSKRSSQLSIESAQAMHSGEYTCTAKNGAGHSSHSAVLNVNGEQSDSFLL